MGSTLLALCRMLAYVLWTLAMAPLQALALWLGLPWRTVLPRTYHRVCAAIMGFDLKTRGEVSATRPTLFVVNHSSYLDITMLGALINGSFVAKSEVGTWPVFGMLARLQRTVFVDRRVRSTGDQRDSLVGRLQAGDNLILFPEGTSSDGNRTLPFKSALFAVADPAVAGRPVAIQPVSIACIALDGIPLGRRLRGAYAWYGDMDLITHMWAMAKLGRLSVVVLFHPVVGFETFGARKALAEHCWREVATGVALANAGRLDWAGRGSAARARGRTRRHLPRWLRRRGRRSGIGRVEGAERPEGAGRQETAR